MDRLRALLSPPPQTGPAAIALLVLRCLIGVAMTTHGWGKMQNPFHWLDSPGGSTPAVFQAAAACSELVGGLLLIGGLLTPVAAFFIACTMVVAVAHHLLKGDPFIGRGGSWELAGLYLGTTLLLLSIGPGRLALDTLLFHRKPQPQPRLESP